MTGILALDDNSTDDSAEILAASKDVVSLIQVKNGAATHANEATNRHKLLLEARSRGADWVLCADADERFETRFLKNIFRKAELADKAGEMICELQIVNLWGSMRHFRLDGLCGPRWIPRFFRLPPLFSERSGELHKPWFPPELDGCKRNRLDAFIYHLRMLHPEDRRARYEKFRAVDPDNTHQAIGYDHLISDDNLSLKRILPWRSFKN